MIASLKPKKEADSASTQVSQIRPSMGKVHKPVAKIKKKSNPAKAEKVKKESSVRIGFRRNLREADLEPSGGVQGSRFNVMLIQEGMGNFRDCFYYTKDCLYKSVPLFEGVKCFADHANAIEEEIHPERSTRDILGHFEDVKYVETNGRGGIMGTLVLCEGDHFEWANSLLTNAIEYAHKYPNGEFVGLSINASGEAGTTQLLPFLQQEKDLADDVKRKLEQALSEGIEEIRPVSILKDAVSCDLVTEAGAGGKILAMMERNKKPMTPKEKKLKEAKEAKEKKEKEAAAAAEAAHEDGDGDGDEDHADAAQDQALFQKMIKQYLGDDGDHDAEEAMKMAKHAHEHFMKQGMEPHEAYEAAGSHLQASAAIGKAMGAPAEGHEGHEESEEEGGHHEEGDQDPPPAPKAKGKGAAPAAGQPGGPGVGKNEESNHVSKQLIKANAELARLRESVGRMEVASYLDKKLASEATKRPPEFISQFREALGKPTSVAHIEETWGIFVKAYDAGLESGGEEDAVFTEKSAYAGGTSASGLLSGGLGDCLQ